MAIVLLDGRLEEVFQLVERQRHLAHEKSILGVNFRLSFPLVKVPNARVHDVLPVKSSQPSSSSSVETEEVAVAPLQRALAAGAAAVLVGNRGSRRARLLAEEASRLFGCELSISVTISIESRRKA
jgi:hypothetical protein